MNNEMGKVDPEEMNDTAPERAGEAKKSGEDRGQERKPGRKEPYRSPPRPPQSQLNSRYLVKIMG